MIGIYYLIFDTEEIMTHTAYFEGLRGAGLVRHEIIGTYPLDIDRQIESSSESELVRSVMDDKLLLALRRGCPALRDLFESQKVDSSGKRIAAIRFIFSNPNFDYTDLHNNLVGLKERNDIGRRAWGSM